MEGRLVKSVRNFYYAIFSQVISLVIGFVVRSVFIKYLGVVYLGVNGLFTNVLTILSLAELGIGTAMIYSMYKPLAENNTAKLQALMNLYRKLYSIIGLVVGVIGLAIIPILPYIIKGAPEIDDINVIYLLFLANSVMSYFYIYKRSILSADQKNYLYSLYHGVFTIIRSAVQIVLVVVSHNFLLFLVAQIVFTLLENIYTSKKVDQYYPYLKERNNEKLPAEDLARIKKDVSALVLSNISRVALNGTASIVISAVVGITVVGLYSNYTMIIGALVMVLSQISVAITGSVGNYIATESRDSHYVLFKRLDLLNFGMYGFCSIAFVVLSKPFVSVWLGDEYVLGYASVAIIGLNFVLEGMLQSFWTFRTTMGLFVQGKYRPVVAAVINIVAAYLLGREFGLIGVLLGTTLSRLMVNMWYDPYIIFKHGLGMTAWTYLGTFLKRMVALSLTLTAIVYFRDNIISDFNQYFQLGLLSLVCIVVIFGVFALLERRNSELEFYKGLIFNVLKIRR